MAERDLCANCGRWREQHYSGGSSIFIADKMDPPCSEYQGTVASPSRKKRKDEDIQGGWETGGWGDEQQ